MKNIYADDLEAFTFDEMLAALQAISQETQRLDFKRLNVGRPALAHLACAFANADGGIIAVGFEDPAEGKTVALLDVVDISDKAKTALAAAINARVQPPLPIALFGYSSGGGQSFLIIRVDQSETAPHEYIGSDFSNLPIRRDAHTAALRLSEIDALRARSDSFPQDSPLAQKQPVIFIGQHSSTADVSIGIRITPAFYSGDRLILDTEDDEELGDIVNRSRGTHSTFFANLLGHTYLDGIHFYEGAHPWWQENGVTLFAPQQISIDSDGEIVLRFLQNDNRPFVQYLFAQAAAYLLAQQVFYRFELAPFARLHLTFRFDERRLKDRPALPEYYGDYFSIDLASQSFTNSILMTTVRMVRVTNAQISTPELRETLERFERDNLPDYLRVRWQ